MGVSAVFFAFLDENFLTKKIFRQFTASTLQLCTSQYDPTYEIINVLKSESRRWFLFNFYPRDAMLARSLRQRRARTFSTQNYYGTVIGNHMQDIEWCQFR